jgi:hypothetical protein
MSRRSFLLAVCIFGGLALLSGTVGLVLVRYEPSRYSQAALPAGPERVEYSQQFYSEFTQLLSDIGGERKWQATFTEQQINGYLNEGFVQSGLSDRVLPEGISDPRVVLEQDRLRLAFRYGSGLWSTVISIDMALWVCENEPNVLALKLTGFHAGALPISAQSLLERISEAGRNNGIDVTWYRHDGHPVALLRFQADQARPTLQLRSVHLKPGVFIIQGNSGAQSARSTTVLSVPGPSRSGP